MKKEWLYIKKFIGFLKIKEKKYPHYQVKCKCGKILKLSNHQINNKTSCGCRRKDRKG